MSDDPRPPWPDDAKSRAARALLDEMRDRGPTPERLAKIERGLAPRLGGGGSSSSGAPRVAFIAGSVAIILVGVLLWAPWSSPPMPETSAPTPAAPAPSARRTPSPAVVPVAPRPAEPTEPPSPSPPAPVVSHRPTQSPAVVEDEASLVDDARAALRHGDAARALSLVRRHERAFANGDLVEEREIVAVEALAATGAHEQARDRGTRFLARWPSSAYALRVRAAIATSP